MCGGDVVYVLERGGGGRWGGGVGRGCGGDEGGGRGGSEVLKEKSCALCDEAHIRRPDSFSPHVPSLRSPKLDYLFLLRYSCVN